MKKWLFIDEMATEQIEFDTREEAEAAAANSISIANDEADKSGEHQLEGDRIYVCQIVARARFEGDEAGGYRLVMQQAEA